MTDKKDTRAEQASNSIDNEPTPAPPYQAAAGPRKSAMASGSTPWDPSGFSFSPNTDVMDDTTMPSDKAAAARLKAAEVMAALKSGEPGAADKAMGDQQQKGSQGILPLRWLGGKVSGMGKKKEEKNAVIR